MERAWQLNSGTYYFGTGATAAEKKDAIIKLLNLRNAH
jgi:hypothetical protein